MTTNRHIRCNWLPGWTLLFLLLLPIAECCSSRSAAIYRQTRESRHTTAAETSVRWRGERQPPTLAPLGEVTGGTAEPLPQAEARVAGPFLIPGDDAAGDARPVSVSAVEAVAAGFDSPEPETYKGELVGRLLTGH